MRGHVDFVQIDRKTRDRGEKICKIKNYKFKPFMVFFQKASNIAATGIYDPFTMDYASWVFNMFDIPMSMMPKIVDSCGDHFGATKPGT